MQKLWRVFKKIVFWTFFVGLFLFTVLAVLLHIYEDEIKQYAIDEINEHLNTDLEVQSIELSLFHDFPRASLEFKNVFIRDAFKTQESNDTLLFSKRSFLTFNVWDIWNEDYTVKRLEFEDSKLNLRVLKNGDVNYDIVKESKDSSESNFKFMLELLRIDKLKFQYSNLATAQWYEIDVEKSLMQGDFSADEFELVTESDVYIRKLKSSSLTLIKNKPAHLAITLDAELASNKFVFKKGDILIGKMPFNVSGFIDSSFIDLAIKGNNIELADLANSLAAGTMPDAPRYNGTGVLNFESQVKGPISSTAMPSVTAQFDLANGTLTNPSNDLQLYDVQLGGSYQNAQGTREEMLTFTSFDLKLLNSYFKGNGDVRNFAQPNIRSKVEGNLDLAAFHRFFRMPGVAEVGGNVQFKMDLALQFLDPQYRTEKFSVSKSQGTLDLSNVVYQLTNDPIRYHDVNGNVVIHDNDAAVKDLKIKTEKSDLVLNGAFNNLFQYITGFGGLGIIASLESNHIDLNEFIGETNTERDEHPEKFILPADLNLNIDLNVGNLTWDKHQFDAITGKLLFSQRKATASDFKLKTMGGQVAGTLTLSNLVEDGNFIDGVLNFTNMDVKTLFAEWKNFDQETITDKHISGRCSGRLEMLLGFNPYFSIIEDKIYAKSTVEMRNGELNDLETMRLITDYMRSNKALKLMLNEHIDKFEEKLLHLKFATLSNTIEIKDRKVFIPEMTISCNALDVQLFGWHDFDNNVEYHFSFRFRDLKTVPEYTEFGKIEDDGLGLIIYLTMTGPVDDPQFALDGDERRNDIRENLADQKQDLKSMLKTEFGLFKNDTTVSTIEQRNKSAAEFIFYEEDIEVIDSTKQRERNKTRTNKVFDRLRQDKENDEEEVEFGEDL